MANQHRKNGSEATHQLAIDERNSVAISAKMHIRVLQAQLLFLRETGSMTTEMEDLLSSLVTAAQGRPATVTQPPKRRAEVEVLKEPLTMSVADDYIGPNVKHLVAQRGDRVIMYGRQKQFEDLAIAFNPRNNSAGQIPWFLLLNEETEQPAIHTEVVVSSFPYGGKTVADVTWKAGDYIRICKWDNKENGIGCNMATGEIGRFNVVRGTLNTVVL